MRYQNAENVQFYRRDSRSVDKAQPRLEKKFNPKIKYYEVKYHCTCINGEKKHISNRGSRRKVCRISNCYDFVSPFSVPLNSSALTSMRFNSLHCYIFFGVPHFFQFCFFVISQQRLRVHFRTASMTLTHYDNTSVAFFTIFCSQTMSPCYTSVFSFSMSIFKEN